jgi:hypothetical protein
VWEEKDDRGDHGSQDGQFGYHRSALMRVTQSDEQRPVGASSASSSQLGTEGLSPTKEEQRQVRRNTPYLIRVSFG